MKVKTSFVVSTKGGGDSIFYTKPHSHTPDVLDTPTQTAQPQTLTKPISEDKIFKLPDSQELLHMQRCDAELRPVFEYLELDSEGQKASPVRHLAKDCVIDGVLKRNTRIVVPKILIHTELNELHTRSSAGHLGRKKTLLNELQVTSFGKACQKM
jgi:hypothetical protein